MKITRQNTTRIKQAQGILICIETYYKCFRLFAKANNNCIHVTNGETNGEI